MHPRTLIIVIVCILGSAVGMRTLIGQFGWASRSEEELLRQATSLTVYYFSGGQQKTCSITNPGEVDELLGLLRMDENKNNGVVPRANITILFNFPHGYTQHRTLFSENTLGDRFIDPEFSRKLQEIVATISATPVNFFAEPNEMPPKL